LFRRDPITRAGRKAVPKSIQDDPTWGARRTRSALITGGGWWHQLPNLTSEWANLGGDGPTSLIDELALADRPGRALVPQQWIMLDKALITAGSWRHRLLNISTGTSSRSSGLLKASAPPPVAHHHPTYVGLLNPLMHQLILTCRCPASGQELEWGHVQHNFYIGRGVLLHNGGLKKSLRTDSYLCFPIKLVWLG
jgi:hypothetical protein